MTKKDYELFASEVYKDYSNYNKEKETVVRLLCRVLRRDNPRFNEEKFVEACYKGLHIRESIKGGC